MTMQYKVKGPALRPVAAAAALVGGLSTLDVRAEWSGCVDVSLPRLLWQLG